MQSGISRLRAVSYTHLDVYKRQAYDEKILKLAAKRLAQIKKITRDDDCL